MSQPSIATLLELWTIDQRRLVLRKARDDARAKLVAAAKATEDADTVARAAQAETDRLAALVRQYQADAERCQQQIEKLRGEQTTAKTNKDYMAIINGIENAKSEKTQREQSVKEITSRQAALQEKAEKAKARAAEVAKKHEEIKTQIGGLDVVTPEEQELQNQYDAVKVKAEPAFLEHYERLIKANHKKPLVRVDSKTRATPYGNLLSHNQVEMIKQGKLVVDRTSNSILYLG